MIINQMPLARRNAGESNDHLMNCMTVTVLVAAVHDNAMYST